MGSGSLTPSKWELGLLPVFGSSVEDNIALKPYTSSCGLVSHSHKCVPSGNLSLSVLGKCCITFPEV